MLNRIAPRLCSMFHVKPRDWSREPRGLILPGCTKGRELGTFAAPGSGFVLSGVSDQLFHVKHADHGLGERDPNSAAASR